MDEFRIYFKNEKLKQYKRINFFVIAINFALFIYIGLSGPTKELRREMLFEAFMILICLGINFLLYRFRKYSGNILIFFIYTIIFIVWLHAGLWWIGGLFELVYLLYSVAILPQIVTINDARIEYPGGFLGRTFLWEKISNMMLKDDLLTIDLKSNKLYQQFIDADKMNFTEAEFNEFCRQQMKRRIHAA
jgi:hypothetical protein